MLQLPGLALGKGFGRRLEGKGEGLVVDGLAAGAAGGRLQRKVADCDGLEVPELAVLLETLVLVEVELGRGWCYVW